jgi:nucleoside-diphosphate-sugar epimerase
MAFKNVALIGGTGTLGAPILKALRATSFNISVLNRESSKSSYPDDVKTIIIPDDLHIGTLKGLFMLNKIDVLIIAIANSHMAEQKKLIEAAFQADVQRVFPAEFGSCDSADPTTNKVLPYTAGKKDIRDTLISMEGKGKLTWTSLITAHFFDWGLTNELLKFNVKERKAYILDGGDIKFSASRLDFIAQAVVKCLQRPEETKNKLLYVHEHYVTQNELLAVLEKVTGDTFEKIPQSSEEVMARTRPKMLAGDHDATEEAVAVWGIVAADWTKKEGFSNELLGLKEVDVEVNVRKVVAKLGN